MERRIVTLCVFALACLLAAGAAAKGKGLRALSAPQKVIFDGQPNEFDTDWRELTHAVKGSASDGDLEAKATVGYDDKGWYVAADVTDDKMVGGGDFVELLFGIPGGTLASFRLFPGVPGKSRAQVKTKSGRTVSGSKIVEAPKSGGYTLEAFIPWKAVPKSRTIRVGYRGGLFVHDADASRSVDTIIGSTDSRRYAKLPPISTMAELALGGGLLRQRNITSPPKYNLIANVVGDRFVERVLVYDRFVVILGPTYRDGEQYYYRDLGTADVNKLDVKDYTGDGIADLLINKTVRGKRGSVDVVEVLSYHDGAETPAAVFAQETRLALSGGRAISNVIRISGGGARTTITLKPGKAENLSAGQIERASSTGATPVLFPWGTIASQTYTVKNGTFVLSREEEQEGEEPTAVATGDTEDGDSPSPQPTAATWQKSSGADTERVYALYKKQRKVKGAPAFDRRANLAGSKSKERLVVHGRDLVVFGPEFRGGRGFSAITLSHFEKGADIKSVTTQDVTRDGRHEIVVRGTIRNDLPEDVGTGQMHRSVIMIYKVRGEVLERVFAAELGRRIGKKRVDARIAFAKKGKFKITLRPGKATGYTEDTYPWLQKDEPDGGFEPLLLPWGGIDKVRLRFDGRTFVR